MIIQVLGALCGIVYFFVGVGIFIALQLQQSSDSSPSDAAMKLAIVACAFCVSGIFVGNASVKNT